MSDTPNLDALMTQSLRSVRSADWTNWSPQPGDAWIVERVVATEPPLTNALLQMYFGFCGWIWQRPITTAEFARVSEALKSRWTSDSFDFDFSWPQDVSTFIWGLNSLQSVTPEQQEKVRQEFATCMPDGGFPGVDVRVPRIDVAKAAVDGKPLQPAPKPPTETGVALDGLFAASRGVMVAGHLSAELYAFFPDGEYLYFPTFWDVDAHRKDPRDHQTDKGNYEVEGGHIRLRRAEDGQDEVRAFGRNADQTELSLDGKTFTYVGDTTGLRV